MKCVSISHRDEIQHVGLGMHQHPNLEVIVSSGSLHLYLQYLPALAAHEGGCRLLCSRLRAQQGRGDTGDRDEGIRRRQLLPGSGADACQDLRAESVSYTHLTLPTIYSV